MRNLLDLALRHMATGTVIGRGLRRSHFQRQMAALLRVAGEALCAEVTDRLWLTWLEMWIVAGEATELAVARAEAAAGLHGCKMLQKVGILLLSGARRLFQNDGSIEKPLAGMKILISLAGLRDARVAGLVAVQANVFTQARSQLRRIDNCPGLLSEGFHV